MVIIDQGLYFNNISHLLLELMTMKAVFTWDISKEVQFVTGPRYQIVSSNFSQFYIEQFAYV